jgi:uncharacterized phage protein (TIGR01671 family)
MREIKFRAKTIAGKTWVYGYLFYDEVEPDCCFINTGKGVQFACIKGTEGQFTGLPDEYGNEICEGDIAQGNDYAECVPRIRGIVQYDSSKAAFYVDDDEEDDLLYDFSYIEIIGNIHDNPELLKGE